MVKDYLRYIRELIKHKDVLYFLTLKDIKVRFKFSTLGFTWAFISPLTMMIILTIIFSFFLRFNVPKYPVFLLVALLPWSFFQLSINNATLSLLANDNLIKKVYFPREIIPLGSILSYLFDFSFSLIVLLLFLIIFRVGFSKYIFFFPFAILVELIFTIGLGLLLSGLTVIYRDIKYIKELLLMVLFYGTPIFYPESFVPKIIKPFYYLNPLAGIMHIIRSLVFYKRSPNFLITTYTVIASIAMFLIGYRIFKKREFIYADLV